MRFDIIDGMANFSKWTTREQWAWVAGFIDGEGCFSRQKTRYHKVHRGVKLTVSQVDRRPLDRLVYLMGGYINGPYPRQHGQSIYYYTCPAKTLDRHLPELWRYLGYKKKKQVLGVIDAWSRE